MSGQKISLDFDMDEIILLKECLMDSIRVQHGCVYRTNKTDTIRYTLSVRKLREMTALKERLDPYGYGYQEE